METPTSKINEIPAAAPSQPEAKQLSIGEQVVEVFKKTYDPEIPVNIYELGMLYGCEVDEKNNVHVRMTLTTPSCPVAGTLPLQVESQIRTIPGVGTVKLDLVWEPQWTPAMMSEAAKLQLGMM